MTDNSVQVNRPEDIDTFNIAIEEYCKAWSNSDGVPDWEYIFSVYANDKGLIYFDAVTPHTFSNPEEMKSAYPLVVNMTLTPQDDLQVYRRGDLVWTTVTQSIKATTPDGQEMNMVQRQTAIWEERDNRWVMLHEHLSAPSSLQV